MGATPLENELMQYWPKLTIVQQESILSVIKSMIKPEAGTYIETYNREIDEAMNRIDEGHFITQDDLEKESEQW
jgi:hypothetical protein